MIISRTVRVFSNDIHRLAMMQEAVNCGVLATVSLGSSIYEHAQEGWGAM